MTHDRPLCFRTRPNPDKGFPPENINLGLAHFLHLSMRTLQIFHAHNRIWERFHPFIFFSPLREGTIETQTSRRGMGLWMSVYGRNKISRRKEERISFQKRQALLTFNFQKGERKMS